VRPLSTMARRSRMSRVEIDVSGSEHEFSRNFRIPIEAGQHKDSSPGDVAYMRRRAFALNQRLQTVLHRRDFDVLRSFLPPKFEYGRDNRRAR
jgi:hypothetical protein